jgi:hypothetical protein
MPSSTNATDPRLDAALKAAAAAGGDTTIPLDEDLYTVDGVPLQCAGSLRQITTAALASADAVFFSPANMEYLAMLLYAFKYPDEEWDDANDHTRCLARRSAVTFVEALQLPQSDSAPSANSLEA